MVSDKNRKRQKTEQKKHKNNNCRAVVRSVVVIQHPRHRRYQLVVVAGRRRSCSSCSSCPIALGTARSQRRWPQHVQKMQGGSGQGSHRVVNRVGTHPARQGHVVHEPVELGVECGRVGDGGESAAVGLAARATVL